MAHIIHIFFILSSFVFEISVIIDCSMLIFQPVIQLIALDSIKTEYIGQIGIISDEIKDHITQRSNSFFLQ